MSASLKRQVKEQQSRIKFLESLLASLQEENRRLASGDDSGIIGSLKRSLEETQAALALARKDRDTAQVQSSYAQYRVSELLSELETIKKRRKRGSLGAAIPPEIWRRLVQLVHPDKHNGSKAANEATAWLMRVRS
jgi:chromosome segregation ATPase